MEVLSRMLRTLPLYPGFSYHPKCVKLKLTHLIFADDLLVFTRGDVPSVAAVASCLDSFAAVSGLQANPLKSCLYFGVVLPSVRSLILQTTGYTEGEFPFKYLGLPMYSSSLVNAMFMPLLDKVHAKVNHYANHCLSYAGKAKLIDSIIFGIHNFWGGASVLLPKGIIKKLSRICKDFLWGINEGGRHWIFMSWKMMCRPKQEGGINIKDIQATLHSNHSWYWGNVLKVRDALVSITGSPTQAIQKLHSCTKHGTLQEGEIYDLFRASSPILPWTNIIHNSMCAPKHAFTAMMVIQNKIPSIENLVTRGMHFVNRCALCENDNESLEHLFFLCSFSSAVWSTVEGWAMISYMPSLRLSQVLDWHTVHNSGVDAIRSRRICTLVATIYHLWRERNARIFYAQKNEPVRISYRIIFDTYVRLPVSLDNVSLVPDVVFFQVLALNIGWSLSGNVG
ncbi:uncharacterized protein LOC141628732 [Silene latifolia]|uniref:uncharacterized protein LOC141628732 n=1 Tax=Silene latifolia TaxID=37657 RepID=UPI003D77389D